MGDIYRQCAKNLVYPGTDDGTVDETLSNIREINKEITKDGHDFRELRSILHAGSASGREFYFRFCTTPLMTPLRGDSLLSFYSRTWFL